MVNSEEEELGTALGLNNSNRAKILFDINTTYNKVLNHLIVEIKEKVKTAPVGENTIELPSSIEDKVATMFAKELYGMQTEPGGVFYAGILYNSCVVQVKSSIYKWFEAYMQFKAKKMSMIEFDKLVYDLYKIEI